jgi:hypothetical protein
MYWFWDWMNENDVRDKQSLRRAIYRGTALNRLTALAPEPVIFERTSSPLECEITAGKGFDLTGDLGCHHIDCLSKEIDGLFRHAWHYFDKISIPDQAFFAFSRFDEHKKRATLVDDLLPYVLVLRRIDDISGLDLIRFEVRNPPCRQHLGQHARVAGFDQGFANIDGLVDEIARTAMIHWKDGTNPDHKHLDYRLDHPIFLHSEWGSICSKYDTLPEDDSERPRAAARHVVHKYLAALSSDALASRRASTPLGSSIPFYSKLLATHPSPQVENVAFEIPLPISQNAPLDSLIKLRSENADAFTRFQAALRSAITERLNSARDPNAEMMGREIRRDIIDPELAKIRTTIQSSRLFAARAAGTGVAIGTVLATVGLMTPLAGSIGGALAVGGAVTIAAALKKANDDELAGLKEVRQSDLYFLFQAHTH